MAGQQVNNVPEEKLPSDVAAELIWKRNLAMDRLVCPLLDRLEREREERFPMEAAREAVSATERRRWWFWRQPRKVQPMDSISVPAADGFKDKRHE